MARVSKIKKAQDGLPKGYVRGEMTGRLIPKKEQKKWQDEATKSMNEQYFNRPENLKYGKGDKKAAPAKAAPKKKMKSGGKQMLKRADGSVSQRGLWDNIRANRGSGKKPTAQMLKQEKKIKAASKKK